MKRYYCRQIIALVLVVFCFYENTNADTLGATTDKYYDAQEFSGRAFNQVLKKYYATWKFDKLAEVCQCQSPVKINEVEQIEYISSIVMEMRPSFKYQDDEFTVALIAMVTQMAATYRPG